MGSFKRWGTFTMACIPLISFAAACGDDDDTTTEAGASETTAAAGDTTTTTAATTTAASDATATTEGDDGSDATPTTEATPSADDPVALADRDAEMTFGNSFSVNSFDPHIGSGASDYIYMRPVYDRLITLAKTDGLVELAPQLATSWTTSDDGMTIEMELRDDVVFQDGAEFDASVVEANFDRAMSEVSTVKSQISRLERVEAVDPTHVVFHLTSPDPAFTWQIASGSVGFMVSPDALENPDLATNPVGSGPWTLESAVKEGDVTYERWDDHWDPDAALVQRLTIATVADLNARYNGTQSGEYDCSNLQSPLDAESKSLESEGYHWLQALAPIEYGVFLNTAMEPTDDVRVRRAISMAIDRQSISDNLLNSIMPPAYQAFPKGYLGYDPDLDVDPYDPDAARALLEEAGVVGETLQVSAPTNAVQTAVANVLQQALGEVGLDVELVPTSPTEGLPLWLQGGVAAQVNTMLAFAEPAQTLDTTYLGLYNHGEPPAELVALADEGARLPVGSPEREAKYQEISAFLVDNPIHVPVVQFSTVFLCRPEVVGSDSLLKEVIGRLDFRGTGIAES